MESGVLDPCSFLFITLDSCRYDTFHDARVPSLEGVGPLYAAMAPAYFTYPSHQAMFVGFTPGVSFRAEPYVNPRYGKFFRMAGGVPSRPDDFMVLEGANIIQGLKHLGYLTLGTGGVSWFNPRTRTGQMLSRDFHRFFYPGDTHSLPQQVDWVLRQLRSANGRRVFLFMNIGETHIPYYHQGAPWTPNDNPCLGMEPARNDAARCRLQQTACLEFADAQLKEIVAPFRGASILICADHGDAWGEDGLWGHGFHHPKVLEVPLLFRLGQSPAPPHAVPRQLWRRLAGRVQRLLGGASSEPQRRPPRRRSHSSDHFSQQ